jgi:hypothetical protein
VSSFIEDSRELRRAARVFGLAVAVALRLPRITDWLARHIPRLGRGGRA